MTDASTDNRLAGAWSFPAINSSADFEVPYLVAKFRRSFGELSATFADGVLAGSVKTASINVVEPMRSSLLGADFFDAEQYPEISFRSTELTLDGDSLTLEGELTMKGVSRKISASGRVAGPTEDFLGHTRLGFSLQTTIDRTDFGLGWNAPLPGGGSALSNRVTLLIDLEFQRN